MGEDKRNRWFAEFREFLNATEVPPPVELNRAVLTRVREELEPAAALVGSKLFGLHAVSAGLITAICPQLGVGPLFGGHGVMHLFMHFGPLACSAICGTLFLGTSTFLATLFLKREELRLAARYGFVNVSILSALTFAGLILAGGTAGQLDYTFWILGAILGGWLILRAGTAVRFGQLAVN